MRDKRPVDELSIEELERILAIRKRDARQARLSRVEARRVVIPHVAPLATPGEESDPIADAPPDTPQFEDEIAPKAAAPIPVLAPTIPVAPRLPVPIDSAPIAPPADSIEPAFEDEDRPRRAAIQPVQRPLRRRVWNRALLVVEVGAVAGLVFLFFSLFTTLQAVSQTSSKIQAEAQQTLQALQVLPTSTPTINVAKLVLPGGHLFDENTNSARYNLGEVPAQYRDVYQQQLTTVLVSSPPTPSPQGPLNIRIPAINVASVIVGGDGWDELKRGVGHHPGSMNPGERGNMVLSAHNDVFGEIFRDLEKLRPGDKIYVSTQQREYVYVMRSFEIVQPDAVRVLDNSQRNIAQLTMITCYPYRVDTQRFVVYAELEAA